MSELSADHFMSKGSVLLFAVLSTLGVVASASTLTASTLAQAIPSPSGVEQRRVGERIVDDTLTLAEVRQMIVGTWIEDVDGEIGEYEKGSLRWVFTEDGMVRKYRDGKLHATESYEVVDKYKGKQAPADISGYLKFTRQDGDIYYMTLTSIERESERPHLYAQTHGTAGSAEPLFFVPARVSE